MRGFREAGKMETRVEGKAQREQTGTESECGGKEN